MREAHRQFARQQFRRLERQIIDAPLHGIGDAVPDAIRPGWPIGQRRRPASTGAIIPALKGLTRNAEAGEAAALEQMGVLDLADDLELFCGGVPHARSSPSAIMLFFEQTEFKRLLGNQFLQRAGLLAQCIALVTRGRVGGITSQSALSGF